MAATPKSQAPEALPAWMTDFSADDRSRGAAGSQYYEPHTSDFQLGSANNDQYSSAWGVSNRANERSTQPVPTGTIGKDRKLIPPGPATNGPSASSSAPTPLPKHMTDFSAEDRSKRAAEQIGGAEIPYKGGSVPGGPGGYGQYRNPTGWDRAARAGKGALTGYDTGNKLANVGLNYGAGAAGLGLANRGAGAVQGATSNRPVFDKTPNGRNTQVEAPGRQQAALTGALNDRSNINQTQPVDRFKGGQTAADGLPEGMTAEQYMLQVQQRANDPDRMRPFAGAQGASGGLPVSHVGLSVLDDGSGMNHIPTQGFRTGGMTPPVGDTPGVEGDTEVPAEKAALDSVLKGGQSYQTDGSNGRIGVAGAGGGYDFAGFDFAQDPANRDVGKSAKYAFSHIAGQAAAAGVPQPRTKQEAEAWFTQHIKPGMDALGYTVHKVVGDKAFISAKEHPDGAWVDFVGNAGGQGPTPLTWQAEMGYDGAADPESIFATQGGGGGESGMDRGEGTYVSQPAVPAVGQVLDSGNKPLDSFATSLIDQLMQGAALDDALGRENRTRRTGITPQSLASVGF